MPRVWPRTCLSCVDFVERKNVLHVTAYIWSRTNMVSSPLPELISPVWSAKHFVSSTEFIIAFIAFIAFTKERETSIDSMLAGLRVWPRYPSVPATSFASFTFENWQNEKMSWQSAWNRISLWICESISTSSLASQTIKPLWIWYKDDGSIQTHTTLWPPTQKIHIWLIKEELPDVSDWFLSFWICNPPSLNPPRPWNWPDECQSGPR